jgi:hypothetical protein
MNKKPRYFFVPLVSIRKKIYPVISGEPKLVSQNGG